MGIEDVKFIKRNIKYFPGFKNFLSKQSIEYLNAYSSSTPTEFVMPSLFTGELPLDKKTYEFGIKYFRKDYIKNAINNRYEIKVLSNTAVISEMMGYKANLFNIDFFNSIQHCWRYFKSAYCTHYLKLEEKKKIILFKKKFLEFLNFFEYFISLDKSWYSNVLNNLNQNKIDRIKKKISLLKKNINKISRRNINEKIINIINKDFFEYFNESGFKNKILNVLAKFFKDKFITWKYAKLNFFNYQFRFQNITQNIDKILHASEKYIKKRKKNFFLISHILDLHHFNFSPDYFFLKKPKKIIFKHNHKYGNDQEMSLIYIDSEINKFLKKIPKKILNNSCICLTSDHGSVADENQRGPLNSDLLCGLFSDRFLRIPFFIYLPGNKILKNKNSNLISSQNIFPILFDHANLKLNNLVKKNLIKSSNQKYLLSESAHRGPAYLNLKKGQIYNCIITKKYKYILKNIISPFDNVKEKEILIKYPNENINLKNKKNNKFIIKIKNILKKRQHEILN